MQNRNIVSLVVVSLIGLSSAGCALETLDQAPDVDETVSESEAAHRSLCPADVPAALTPDPDQTLKGIVNAVGAQVYVCTSTPSSPTPAWTFMAPQANLLADNGRLLGTHFIGPTWQDNDGSSVQGSKLAGATVDGTAIPWLLLKATTHAGDGYFSDVTSIQRLSTVGGNAPSTGCDAEHLGAISQVPYSAEYAFYKTKTRGKVVQCKVK